MSFYKDQEMIKNYCQAAVEINSVLPQFLNITDGLWLLVPSVV